MQVKPESLMDVKQFEKFKNVVKKYTPKHEYEFRLGKKSMNRFDTNIGHELFTKILSGLEKYTQWESVVKSDESVFYKDPDYRIIIDNINDSFVHQTKKKCEVVDEKTNKKLDIRLAVSLETECPDKECEMDREVRRLRTTFHRKNVAICCTEVKGQPKDCDEESDTQYQVEIEFQPSDDDVELFNRMHKVFNVLELC